MKNYVRSKEKVEISTSNKFDMIECPFCHWKFVMFAVLSHTPEDCDFSTYQVYRQGRTNFCPECGKEMVLE